MANEFLEREPRHEQPVKGLLSRTRQRLPRSIIWSIAVQQLTSLAQMNNIKVWVGLVSVNFT